MHGGIPSSRSLEPEAIKEKPFRACKFNNKAHISLVSCLNRFQKKNEKHRKSDGVYYDYMVGKASHSSQS